MLQQRVLSRRLTGSDGEKIFNLRGPIEGWAGAFTPCSRPLTTPYICRGIN